MNTKIGFALGALSLIAMSAQTIAGETQSPPGAKTYIISPANGATVKSPFLVQFGLSGMGIAPAGVDKPKTGHEHLLIDTDVPDPASAIPADANHIHFGGGQTEAMVTLPPGKHTLQLLLGDANHIPHDPVVKSEVITVIVQ